MFNYSFHGITVADVYDCRVKNKKEKYPVKIRVTYKRERKYYATGKKITITEWDSLPTTKSKKLIQIRDEIQKTFEEVKDNISELYVSFSFDALNSRLSLGSSTTFNTVFKSRIDTLKQEDRIGTAINYSYALNAVERFAGDNVQFNSINIQWLERFEKFLINEGKSYTTIGIYGRAIRSIIGQAKNIGFLKESSYPFGSGKYKIPEGEGRKIALTLEQVGKIVKYTDNFNKTPLYRDMWVFSYLCNGINVADMLQLKFSNITNSEIFWIRQKTIRTSKKKKEIRAIIVPEMQRIIDQHGNPPIQDNYIFPFLKGGESPERQREIIKDITKRINRKMKTIGNKLNIGNISTYCARHSYATVLKRSGANIAYISESLGHTDLKTTENYLASFERDERIKNAKLLTKFDNGTE